MNFEFSEQKLSTDEINNVEKELKIKLPEKYRKLMLEYNGGSPASASVTLVPTV